MFEYFKTLSENSPVFLLGILFLEVVSFLLRSLAYDKLDAEATKTLANKALNLAFWTIQIFVVLFLIIYFFKPGEGPKPKPKPKPKTEKREIVRLDFENTISFLYRYHHKGTPKTGRVRIRSRAINGIGIIELWPVWGNDSEKKDNRIVLQRPYASRNELIFSHAYNIPEGSDYIRIDAKANTRYSQKGEIVLVLFYDSTDGTTSFKRAKKIQTVKIPYQIR